MEEKKLTDEEIAKAILQNIEYSSPITYIDEWGNCKNIMLTDILNLIYRLQDEKQKIIQDYYCESQQCDVQKAEIERLNKCVMSEEQIRKCCADIIQETMNKAVKDTAKEMWKKAKHFYRQYPLSTEVVFCCFRDWIKERYGAEVE